MTYAIYSKPDIKSPADLKGKTFAISAPGALPDLVARAVLAQNNVPAADVKFTVMGSDADRFKAVTAGIVDAAAASSGFAPAAEKAGVRMLVHAIEAVPNYVRFCIYSTAKTLAARKDQIEVLQKLLAEAGLYTAVVDGKMGPHTRRAIAEAETHAGLAQTGQPSPELYAALRQQPVPPSSDRATIPPDQGPSTAASSPPDAPARTAAKVPAQGRRGSVSSPRGARTSSRCTVVWGSRWCWPWPR